MNKIIVERNQTIFDLTLMIEGSIENIYEKVILKYNITEPFSDLTGLVIENPEYNLNSAFVQELLMDKRKPVTGDNNIFEAMKTGAFSDGFSSGYDIGDSQE